jgi:hypothetical protein
METNRKNPGKMCSRVVWSFQVPVNEKRNYKSIEGENGKEIKVLML